MTDGAPEIDVRALLEAHGLHARKALGQNFLRDAHVLARIAAAAAEHAPGWIVEIGAGLGSLTAALARTGQQIVAIEHDRRLVPILGELFARTPNVRIVEGDATTLRIASLVPEGLRPAVAGNLPYSISTPLLLALLRQRTELGPATVMLQREFADRVRADAGTRDYGSLSVLFSLHADVERIFDVKPGSFVPAPKVHSSVLRLEWLDALRVPVPDEAEFERMVRAAFSQRRKTLRNSLGTRYERAQVEAAAARAGIDLGRRAETLTVSELAKLAWSLSEQPRPDA